MDTIPVTLIVKTPNQQFEDQTIKCELTWSIRKLKGYLSEVYPCKPVSATFCDLLLRFFFISMNQCVRLYGTYVTA